MKVPYNYLPYEFCDVEEIIDEWRVLIKTTEFTIGRYVTSFENKFASYLGVSHCVATNNGTDALILALKSLGIGSGDEVITVTNTFYATVGAIVAVGAKPVFVDSDDRYQIDAAKVSSAITDNTKAVIPVHWAGASPNIHKIQEICSSAGIYMVEDACMGIGATLNGKRAGTFGKVNAFSMHPLKSLNVMGDGGMVVTNDDEIATWIRKYRNHGMSDRNHIDFWGVNMRLQPLQAVVASRGLDEIEGVVKKRNLNAEILDIGLSDLGSNVTIPERKKGFVETYALYMALFDQRECLREHLTKHGIETRIHYPIPLHLQAAAKSLHYKVGDFPVSERQAQQLITIPVHQYIDDQQLGYTIGKIHEFYKQ